VTLLEVDGLRVSLPLEDRLRPILLGVGLTVAAGEAVGLVGESGSGKSMTARAIMRLLPAGARVEGEIAFAGRSVLSMSADALRAYRGTEVAMIFQDPRAHTNPVRTIGDFLTEALLDHGLARRAVAHRTAVDLLASVGIDRPERRMSQYPHELSGGMLQRVMIAAALATEPQLLLADEPTTALDVTTQSEVMAILAELRAERRLATLFITHDLELAIAVCDRILVMYAGTIVEDSPARSLHERARHPYTIGLLASRPDPVRRTARLQAIPGRPVGAWEAGAGCPFAGRCAYVTDRCREQRPPLREVAGGLVACHHAEAVLAGRAPAGTEAR
jgi:oligopeptide/dipeptide ABC transporter ATP-binding protein